MELRVNVINFVTSKWRDGVIVSSKFFSRHFAVLFFKSWAADLSLTLPLTWILRNNIRRVESEVRFKMVEF